ncbi:MAG TPA: hypothetical protein VM487_02710, partial [Phycisphaerae bacterium]|nr:hypothetical protein [Phycisphaerae bacterium]
MADTKAQHPESEPASPADRCGARHSSGAVCTLPQGHLEGDLRHTHIGGGYGWHDPQAQPEPAPAREAQPVYRLRDDGACIALDVDADYVDTLAHFPDEARRALVATVECLNA